MGLGNLKSVDADTHCNDKLVCARTSNGFLLYSRKSLLLLRGLIAS